MITALYRNSEAVTIFTRLRRAEYPGSYAQVLVLYLTINRFVTNRVHECRPSNAQPNSGATQQQHWYTAEKRRP